MDLNDRQSRLPLKCQYTPNGFVYSIWGPTRSLLLAKLNRMRSARGVAKWCVFPTRINGSHYVYIGWMYTDAHAYIFIYIYKIPGQRLRSTRLSIPQLILFQIPVVAASSLFLLSLSLSLSVQSKYIYKVSLSCGIEKGFSLLDIVERRRRARAIEKYISTLSWQVEAISLAGQQRSSWRERELEGNGWAKDIEQPRNEERKLGYPLWNRAKKKENPIGPVRCYCTIWRSPWLFIPDKKKKVK